jgi:acetate kinase
MREWHDAGVRRYGFHGLSHDYIARVMARKAPDLARGRIVIAHLGASASLCAVPAANTSGKDCVSTTDSRPVAWVIPTDEAQMIAIHTVEALRDATPTAGSSSNELRLEA